MDNIQEQFYNLLIEKGIPVSDLQLQQFEIYYRELIEWNEKINLTSITDREQVYVKHFYDSLSLSFCIDLNEVDTLADIGSGAGFPSLPVKILFPHLKVTIIDSLNKRILFLKQLAEKLNLSSIHCVHGRAEDIARLSEYRDQFDLVTARAVARLSILNEFCLPFCKPTGTFVAMKGADIEEEVQAAKYSLTELKGKIAQVNSFELPIEHSARHVIVIKKTSPTPAKYPRKAGTPVKLPLEK